MEKTIRFYINLTGSILLALATIFFLANLQLSPQDFVFPHDPIFDLHLPVLFWILSGLLLVLGLFCLFSPQTFLPLLAISWLATNLVIYWIGLRFVGTNGSIRGYLGNVAVAFGLPAGTIALVLTIAIFSLLASSTIAVTYVAKRERTERANPSLKMSCAHCGGHIKFLERNLNETISCPHCRNSVCLRRPEDHLKMSCFFCKEHIEFPAHALGQKIKCPHCQMEVGLKEEMV